MYRQSELHDFPVTVRIISAIISEVRKATYDVGVHVTGCTGNAMASMVFMRSFVNTCQLSQNLAKGVWREYSASSLPSLCKSNFIRVKVKKME
jgi:hypothetical protein